MVGLTRGSAIAQGSRIRHEGVEGLSDLYAILMGPIREYGLEARTNPFSLACHSAYLYLVIVQQAVDEQTYTKVGAWLTYHCP